MTYEYSMAKLSKQRFVILFTTDNPQDIGALWEVHSTYSSYENALKARQYLADAQQQS